MRVARLASQTDFAGWRAAARSLRGAGVSPEAAVWTVDGEGDLFDEVVPLPATTEGGFTVPKGFMELAEPVILHRSPERFALLYRLLWRLQSEPNLLHIASDPDVAAARDMAGAVSKAAHKMKAFVRFRKIEDAPEETYVAWFEPAHRVTEATAPFFARRYANMAWSILTPDACAHWDRRKLHFTPGADKADAPDGDALEDYWRTYYASTFNPARLKVAAMQKEMPKRYWRNLPEAGLIPELIEAAEGRTSAMVAQTPSEPSRRIVRQAQRLSRDGSFEEGAPGTLDAVAAGVDVCRRCELWRDATQGVAGEGLATARLMFVGEQPGDLEDLAGRPFVGPAGQMLDRALAEAGVPRAETYVTNAVKHFRHEQRGKRRIHQTPTTRHVEACRWWLDAERRIVRPRVIVALGGTAAQAVFGKATPIAANRGKALQLTDQAQGVVTYHPSYLLRVPDAAAKATAHAAFVDDLRFAWKLAS
ncbi:UdgX family uracil-DNA binding protein [Phenylobacterium sp. LH3H17]|uniref:UdgX family uracil-DNA binding protein n=1 Tax=Phenylobacterium sp. LH3H17 TaxID=2903901 RepID=UPI0020C97ED2|nr:UdgX family uracil-DNA binding protein [Phenylobacterium sp. LH3H17]UTP40747.1 UdgX family uracil-DNA binding protein [Phenylobacterium sp. LH3H17]